MSAPYPTKADLLDQGIALARRFCDANGLDMPTVEIVPSGKWRVSFCAYYRPGTIKICIERCAAIGVAGMAWSYPGYTIDRTPYGVIQHELGHHADWVRGTDRGPYWSDFSVKIRDAAGEPKLTNYCPNDAEWFAEMFRLFVTNPALLCALRPRTYGLLLDAGFVPAFTDRWEDRLAGAPSRTLDQARKKMAEVAA